MPPPSPPISSIPGAQSLLSGARFTVRATLGVPVAVVSALIAIPRLTQHVAELTRPGGAVESLASAVQALEKLDHLVAPLERLADLQDELQALGALQEELKQLGHLEDELEAIAGFETVLNELAGPIAQLAKVTQVLPDLARSAESLPPLVIEVREVRALVTHLDQSFDNLLPMLRDLNEFAGGLGDDVDELSDALQPISSLAGHLPGGRKARRAAEKARKAEAAAAAKVLEAGGEEPARTSD